MEGHPHKPSEEKSGTFTYEAKSASPVTETDSVTNARDVHEEDVAFMGAKTNPNARLEYAKSAAEREDPLALLLEQQHEVKDRRPKTGATPVGDIAAKAISEQISPTPASHSVSDPQSPSSPPPAIPIVSDDQTKLPSLYKLAIAWGFVLALVVLLAWFVVWLVTG